MKQRFKRLWLQSPRPRQLLIASLGATLTLSLAFAQLWTPEEIIQNSSVALPLEQIIAYPDLSDTNAIAWARYSILNPREATELVESRKNPEQRTMDEWKRLAILNPDGYQKALEAVGAAQTPTPEAQAARAKALISILRPHEIAQDRERSKTPEDRRREELAKQAILNPREFNAQVNRLKTPDRLEKETQALRAVLQPKIFNEELHGSLERGVADTTAPLPRSATSQP